AQTSRLPHIIVPPRLGKNARMIRPARVSCGPSAGNGLPLMPSASARSNRVGREAPAVHQPLRPAVSLARTRVASLQHLTKMKISMDAGHQGTRAGFGEIAD